MDATKRDEVWRPKHACRGLNNSPQNSNNHDQDYKNLARHVFFFCLYFVLKGARSGTVCLRAYLAVKGVSERSVGREGGKKKKKKEKRSLLSKTFLHDRQMNLRGRACFGAENHTILHRRTLETSGTKFTKKLVRREEKVRDGERDEGKMKAVSLFLKAVLSLLATPSDLFFF